MRRYMRCEPQSHRSPYVATALAPLRAIFFPQPARYTLYRTGTNDRSGQSTPWMSTGSWLPIPSRAATAENQRRSTTADQHDSDYPRAVTRRIVSGKFDQQLGERNEAI